ncbi:hypothetical protein [Microlunatus sp. GCM10028923]|uniref:hypothetical protein n=1 Tax=Microlunatus sp. GCM10028923 TaxID=3273400 RepID=UPI0036170765
MTESTEFPNHDGGRLPEPAHSAAGPARPLVGRAESVSVVTQPGQVGIGDSTGRSGSTTLTFRLRRPDESLVEVMLRGLSIAGSVHEGDQVEVPDRPDRSGRIEVVELRNLTTGARVKAEGSPKSGGARVFRIVFLALLAILLIVFIGVLAFIVSTAL